MVMQKDIARHWGVSKQTVSDCVKNKGCPTTCLEDADAWRAANVRNPGSRSAPPRVTGLVAALAGAAPGQAPEAFLATLPPLDYGTSVEALLNRAIRSEILAAYSMERARQQGVPDLIQAMQRSHNGAVTARLTAEDLVEKRRQSASKLLSVEQLHAVIDSVIDPLLAVLDGLPAELGPRCNPSGKELAAAILSDKVQEIKALLGSSLKTMKDRIRMASGG